MRSFIIAVDVEGCNCGVSVFDLLIFTVQSSHLPAVDGKGKPGTHGRSSKVTFRGTAMRNKKLPVTAAAAVAGSIFIFSKNQSCAVFY